MDYEEFESELGNVAVTPEHIERERKQSEEWEKIRENFPPEKLIDMAHFSDIEEIQFHKGTMYPYIEIDKGDGWRKLFFKHGEDAEECFKCLRYRWHAFKQNNG